MGEFAAMFWGNSTLGKYCRALRAGPETGKKKGQPKVALHENWMDYLIYAVRSDDACCAACC